MTRLDKFISNNTNYSRKNTKKIINLKKVTINDFVVTDETIKINPEKDVIKINDEIIGKKSFVYIALNKPKGYVCSNSNIEGLNVFELILENHKNLHTIGRLDKDTTGLVILTNDGSFTHFIKSPKNEIEKEYQVWLEKPFEKNMFDKLNQDIYLDGKKIKKFKIKNIDQNKLNIILYEGKYHHIKRIFKIVNNPVIKLNRIRINKLSLENLNLELGKYKYIEIKDILDV